METASFFENPAGCPSGKELADFSVGKLPLPRLEAVAEHLSACRRCEATLDALDLGGDTALSDLRQTVAAEPILLEPECEQLEAYAKAIRLNGCTVPSPLPVQLPRPNADRANDPPVAAQLGSYEILERLGKGGMGVVYKARQRNLNRLVALKRMLSGAYASPQELARFHVEATDLARLRHPNIVQIYEIGEEENCPYFAMELVDGGNLARRLDGVPLLARRGAELIETLARAMHHAHQQGIVHRDLKPANVLFTADGVPKITDFGLAKGLDHDSGHTEPGAILGTPPYMAPEQACGNNHEIGPVTDVYGLGAILYEMLTGRPPFRGATAADTLHQVRFQEPVPPSRFQPNVPRDLETICLKCLQREPHKRYASALLLAEDVRRFLRDEPIQARPVGPVERLWCWCRRNPALAAVSGLAALFLVVAATVSTVFAFSLAQFANRLSHALADTVENRQQLIETSKRSARIALVQGLSLWEQREPDRGMLWFAHSLESATRAEDTDLERVIRLSLAAARRQISPLRACLAHGGDVLAVAFSPDGKTVLTGSKDGKAQLWDASSGEPVGEPLLHQEPVHAVAFSPDGKSLVTGSGDFKEKKGSVSLWQTGTGIRLGNFLRCEGPVHAVAFSPDGRSILLGGFHATHCLGDVRLWNVVDGSVRVIHQQPGEPINAVAFNPDGQTILFGVSNTAQVWNVVTGQRIGKGFKHKGAVRAVAFSPNGKMVLTSSDDKTARAWEACTGQPIGQPLCHSDAVPTVAFSPDGQTILTGCNDNMARLWQTSTGEPMGAPLRHRGRVLAVAFRADGKGIVTGGDDKTARLWDVAPWKPMYRTLQHAGPVRAVAFAPDGRIAVTGSRDKTAQLWETATGKMVGCPLAHQHAVFALSISPDSKTVLTGSWDKTAALWDARTGERLHELKAHTDLIYSAVFSPDGKLVLTASADGSARLWNVTTGQLLGQPLHHQDSVSAATFSADSRIILTGSADHTVRLWEAASGKPIRSFLGHQGGVKFVAFSPDGTRVLTGSFDNTARVWETASGQRQGAPLVHQDAVWAGTFSPDGKTAVTASLDGTARLWNADTGMPFGPVFQHGGRILAVAFSRNGQMLLTGSRDGTARLWDVATGEPIGPSFWHTGPVWAAAFSPDEQTILTGSEDGTARLWEAPVLAPVQAQPEQIQLWTQRITGMRLENGQTSVMDSKTWHDCRQDLAEKGGSPEP